MWNNHAFMGGHRKGVRVNGREGRETKEGSGGMRESWRIPLQELMMM